MSYCSARSRYRPRTRFTVGAAVKSLARAIKRVFMPKAQLGETLDLDYTVLHLRKDLGLHEPHDDGGPTR